MKPEHQSKIGRWDGSGPSLRLSPRWAGREREDVAGHPSISCGRFRSGGTGRRPALRKLGDAGNHQFPAFHINSQTFWIFLFQPAMRSPRLRDGWPGQKKQRKTVINSQKQPRPVKNDLRYTKKNQSNNLRYAIYGTCVRPPLAYGSEPDWQGRGKAFEDEDENENEEAEGREFPLIRPAGTFSPKGGKGREGGKRHHARFVFRVCVI
jgi:hypothetical protein